MTPERGDATAFYHDDTMLFITWRHCGGLLLIVMCTARLQAGPRDGSRRTPEAPIYGCPRYWGFEGPKSALSLSEFWGFEGKIAQTLSVFGDLRLIWDALDPVHGPKII